VLVGSLEFGNRLLPTKRLYPLVRFLFLFN